MDSASAKPMHERTFGQFVRILVDIDLLQPLRHKLLVERKGFAFFVDLEYEHIPAFCDGCKVIGHNFENCKRWNKEDDLRNDKEINVKKKAPAETRQVFVPTKDGRNLQSKPTEPVNVEKEIINVENTTSKSPQANLEVGNKNDCGSFSKNNQVSPIILSESRIPVSPRSLLRQQDLQLEKDLNTSLVVGNKQVGESSSKINQATPIIPSETGTILSPVSPRSLLREQEKQLENDLNEDFDEDTGSQDSFVNDTQIDEAVRQVENSRPIMESTLQHEKVANVNVIVNIPDRVEKDMAFLKESWANIAEAEEESHKNLEDTGQHAVTHEDGFQVQLSKGHKRAQKKLKQSSRDSYATRSKWVSPRPFR
jgi:hypothetical protein